MRKLVMAPLVAAVVLALGPCTLYGWLDAPATGGAKASRVAYDPVDDKKSSFETGDEITVVISNAGNR